MPTLETEQQSAITTLPNVPSAEGLRAFTLPISRRQEATLYVPKALDERGWQRMMRVLDAMKEGILSDEDEDGGDEDIGGQSAPGEMQDSDKAAREAKKRDTGQD